MFAVPTQGRRVCQQTGSCDGTFHLILLLCFFAEISHFAEIFMLYVTLSRTLSGSRSLRVGAVSASAQGRTLAFLCSSERVVFMAPEHCWRWLVGDCSVL